MNALDQATTTVSPDETARRMGITRDTLANWRIEGKGPPYVKVGARVRYRLIDLAEYLASEVRTSTSDPGSQER